VFFNATTCKRGLIMVKDAEHISPRLLNTTLADKGKFAFNGSLALSLIFHAALFSVFISVRENMEDSPRKPAVIEIDLSAIETPSNAKTARPPAQAGKQPATNKPANPSAGTARQTGPPAIQRSEQKIQEQPSRVFHPVKDQTITSNEMRTGTTLPGTAANSPAAGEKAAETPSGAAKEGAGDRHGDGGEGSESRDGNGHGTKAALAEYSRTVRSLIERHKEYPLAARKLGIHGSVVVSFSLDRHGELQGVSLVKSSGNSMLDNAGIRAVRDVGTFPPPPRHAMQGEVISFRIPVRFALATG